MPVPASVLRAFRYQWMPHCVTSCLPVLVAVRKRGILALRRGLVWCTADPHRFLPHCHHPIGPSGGPPDTSYRPAPGVQDRAPSVLNVSRPSPTPASRPLIHSSATTATQFQCPWVRSHDRRPGPARRGKITPRTLAENSSRIRDGQALVASGKHRSPNTTVTRHVLHHQGGRIRHLMPRPRLEIYRTASMGNTLIPTRSPFKNRVSKPISRAFRQPPTCRMLTTRRDVSSMRVCTIHVVAPDRWTRYPARLGKGWPPRRDRRHQSVVPSP